MFVAGGAKTNSNSEDNTLHHQSAPGQPALPPWQRALRKNTVSYTNVIITGVQNIACNCKHNTYIVSAEFAMKLHHWRNWRRKRWWSSVYCTKL